MSYDETGALIIPRRDRSGRFKVTRFKAAVAGYARRGGRFAARSGYRIGRAGVHHASRQAIGLTPSEYIELRRLRELKRDRGLTGDEGYIAEMRRLKFLEARYKGKLRKEQTKKLATRIYQESAFGRKRLKA